MQTAQFTLKTKKILIEKIFTYQENNVGRDLGHSCKESSLKTLIMRNCYNLQEVKGFKACFISLP